MLGVLLFVGGVVKRASADIEVCWCNRDTVVSLTRVHKLSSSIKVALLMPSDVLCLPLGGTLHSPLGNGIVHGIGCLPFFLFQFIKWEHFLPKFCGSLNLLVLQSY